MTTSSSRAIDRAGRIRGKTRSVVVDRLRQFDAQAGSGAARTYILMSDGTGTLLRELFRSPPVWWRFMRKLRYGLPAVVRLRCPKAKLRVKNNMTIIFASPAGDGAKLVAKIGLPSELRRGILSREIRARKMVPAGPGDTLHPRLVRYGDELWWFIEEFVASDTSVLRRGRVAAFLARAAAFYSRTCRPRPLGRSIRQYGFTFAGLQEVFRAAGSHLPDSCEASTWPVALIHGDVGPGNIVVNRAGGLVLLDWELFGKGSVAWDMRALVPYDRPKVGDVLRAIGVQGDLDPDVQLRIVAAIELGRLRQRWDRALRYYAGFGMTPARALRRVEARAAVLVERVKGGDGKPKDNPYFDR